jgi:RNA polymerase primary sigma factor
MKAETAVDAVLLALVALMPGSDKRQLSRALRAAGLRLDPSSVNSLLYRLESAGKVRKIDSTPPVWLLTGELEVDSGTPLAAFNRRSPESEHANPPRSTAPDTVLTARTRDLRPWQEEALDAWAKNQYVGVVEAVTGTGKTQVGIEAINEQLTRHGKALVIVPSRALVAQWYRQLDALFSPRVGRCGDGHVTTFRARDVIVSTVQSAMKPFDLYGQEGLLVADECHRYGASQWSRALDPAYARRLGLSATYRRGDDGDAAHLAPYFGAVPVYGIDFRRAIDDDVVAPFRLAFLGVRLSDDDRDEYDELTDIMAKHFGTLVNRFDFRAQPPAEFMKMVALAADGKVDDDATWPARGYVSAMAKRRALLGDNPEKLELLRALAPAMNHGAGTLVFTQTKKAAVAAAEALAEATGMRTAAIYGDLDSSDRERILEAFRERHTTILSAPRVLDEGIDVPDADLGIVMAASNGRRQMIQRMGRVLRNAEGKDFARLVIFFAEGTNEDPDEGAHEGFIGIAWDVASSSKIFRGRYSAKSVVSFLSSHP